MGGKKSKMFNSKRERGGCEDVLLRSSTAEIMTNGSSDSSETLPTCVLGLHFPQAAAR